MNQTFVESNGNTNLSSIKNLADSSSGNLKLTISDLELNNFSTPKLSEQIYSSYSSTPISSRLVNRQMKTVENLKSSPSPPEYISPRYEKAYKPEFVDVPLKRIKGTSILLTKKETYWTQIIIISIIFIILLMIVVVFIILIFGDETKSKPKKNYQPPYDMDAVDGDLGGSTNGVVSLLGSGTGLTTENQCVDSENLWDGSVCHCNLPYYGDTCQFESWDSRFFAFGNSSDIGTKIKFQSYTPRDHPKNKSFKSEGKYDKKSCSALSLSDPESVGFTYDDKHCNIIIGPISIETGTNITYNPLRESKLYMKRGKGPIVPNKVFAMGKGDGALRFYVSRPNTDHFFTISPNIIRHVNFTPDTLINASQMVGIWSSKNFSPSDFKSMYYKEDHKDYYIDMGKSYSYNVSFNSKMKSDVYYVMYIHRSNL